MCRMCTRLSLRICWCRIRSGLHLMPGWSYTSRKEATRDDAVSVPGYNLFNLGARYTPGGEQGHMTLRLYADNIFNKRYWKDTGASYGDTFIHRARRPPCGFRRITCSRAVRQFTCAFGYRARCHFLKENAT